MSAKLDEMWAAFEAHKPTPEYADAWQTMCKERTRDAALTAYYAAPAGSAAKEAAISAAWAILDAALAEPEPAPDAIARAVEAEREACIGDIFAAYNPLIHGTWVEGASPIENSIKAIRARGEK